MDSKRSPFVTQRFPQLQGLRLMPTATLFVLSSSYRAGLFRLPGDARPGVAGRWFFFGLVIAIAASYPIRDWYREHFSLPTQRVKDSQFWPLVAGFACVVLAISVQGKAHLPFSLPIVVVGLLLGSVGVADYPYRHHFLAAGAVLVAEALLRPLGVPESVRSVLFDLAIAAALTIVGIGDHRLLATTLSVVVDDVPSPLREVEADV